MDGVGLILLVYAAVVGTTAAIAVNWAVRDVNQLRQDIRNGLYMPSIRIHSHPIEREHLREALREVLREEVTK